MKQAEEVVQLGAVGNTQAPELENLEANSLCVALQDCSIWQHGGAWYPCRPRIFQVPAEVDFFQSSSGVKHLDALDAFTQETAGFSSGFSRLSAPCSA